MEEAEALCNRVVIIDSGKIIVLGTPEELKSQIPGNDIVSLSLAEPPGRYYRKGKDLAFCAQDPC